MGDYNYHYHKSDLATLLRSAFLGSELVLLAWFVVVAVVMVLAYAAWVLIPITLVAAGTYYFTNRDRPKIVRERPKSHKS